ncbi:methyltransferase domain-containing protein [Halorubrum sp. DTA98]|uniref:methyltransferase domain-containing protein n=1 Tax=Halorubrum sp. DTA98 TaxID=3402163 RepID=UPI003AAE07E5
MTDAVEYLTAKRTVDDRALNRRVWDRFVAALDATARRTDRPLRIVEVGTGVGSMIARLADWETLSGTVSYRAVDVDETCIAAARDRLPEWLAAAGYETETTADGVIVATDATTTARFEIVLEVADARSIVDEADAVIAAAFLDIVDPDRTLRAIRGMLREGGFLYAPCTFDGATHFSPAHPSDDRIERLYHRHMDELRDRPGSSRAAREVLERAPEHGYDVDAVGSGDWVVRPRDGTYPHAEGRFLDHLLETIDGALADYPADVLDPAVRAAWIDARRDQRSRGELRLVSHHLDLLARVRPDE